MKRIGLVLFGLALASGGCKGRGDCEVIVDHTLEIGLAERTVGLTEEQTAKVKEQVMGRRAEAIDQCEKRKPSKNAEKCALAAETLDDIAACK